MTDKYTAEWSGKFPNLCSGIWTLFLNDEIVDVDIPFQGQPANTNGIFYCWHFADGWEEVWDDYEDGMPFADWATEYEDYLQEVAGNDYDAWRAIYEAFQAADWRPSSCGGCI